MGFEYPAAYIQNVKGLTMSVSVCVQQKAPIFSQGVDGSPQVEGTVQVQTSIEAPYIGRDTHVADRIVDKGPASYMLGFSSTWGKQKAESELYFHVFQMHPQAATRIASPQGSSYFTYTEIATLLMAAIYIMLIQSISIPKEHLLPMLSPQLQNQISQHLQHQPGTYASRKKTRQVVLQHQKRKKPQQKGHSTNNYQLK